MGYSVHYSPQTEKKFPQKKVRRQRAGLGYLILIICILSLGFLRIVKPALLRELLIPGEASVTLKAAETMVSQIKEGVPLQETVEAFCQEIMSHDLSA